MTHKEMDKVVKNPATYIKNIVETTEFGIENIVVEHRSNNPKRDYLFVNKKQCKHIPCSPTEMVNMCKLLANEVNNKLGDKEVVVVAFAETATAIGNCVADYLNKCTYVLQTTREIELENIGEKVITFEEEHSHATTQLLLTSKDSEAFNLAEYNGYILFVEDEISTGNTILNFINAMDKVKTGLSYGVASVCNWQSKENRNKFNDKDIDTFFLLGGELADVNAKMLQYDDRDWIDNTKCHNYAKFNDSITMVYDNTKRETGYNNLFESERLGHKTNRDFSKLFEEIDKIMEGYEISKVRVVGTEEFMYIPIKVGEYLESKGIEVVCHATTRSCIDVLSSENESYSKGIIERFEVDSPYELTRKTYLYNLGEKVDLTLYVTDHTITDRNAQCYFDVLHGENNDDTSKCNLIAFVRV